MISYIIYEICSDYVPSKEQLTICLAIVWHDFEIRTWVPHPIHWPICSFPEILNLTRSWICLPIPPSYTESWYMRYNLNSNLLDMMIWMTEIPHKQKGSISTNFRNSTKIHLHSSYRREKSHKEVAQSPELKAKHNETLFASTDSVFRKGSNVFCCIWEVSAQNYKAKLTQGPKLWLCQPRQCLNSDDYFIIIPVLLQTLRFSIDHITTYNLTWLAMWPELWLASFHSKKGSRADTRTSKELVVHCFSLASFPHTFICCTS